MRRYQHLDPLVKQNNGVENKTEFTDLLIDLDSKQSSCLIFGETVDEQLVLLAELKIQEGSLNLLNGLFQQRIEFVVEGGIINDQYPALTYRVSGAISQFHGRCSTIPQICGVDLYSDKSYTGKKGGHVKQKFTIPVNKLYRSLT